MYTLQNCRPAKAGEQGRREGDRMNALAETTDTFHEGYLYLRVGKSLKTSRLQKGWAVLKFESAEGQRRIDFYDPKGPPTAAQTPTMSLPISNTLGVKADTPARGLKYKYPFLVLTTSTKYQLFTESEEDRKKWMGKLYQLLYGPPIQGRVYEHLVQIFPTRHSAIQELEGQYVLRVSDTHLSLYSNSKGQHKTKFNCPLLQVERTQQGSFPNQSDQYSPFADQSSTVTCLVLHTSSTSPMGFGVFVFCTQSAQEISTVITHRQGQLLKERGCGSPTSQYVSHCGHVSLDSSQTNNSLNLILEDPSTNHDQSRYTTAQTVTAPQPGRAQARDRHREEIERLQKPMIRSISHSSEALHTASSKSGSLTNWWEEKESGFLRPTSPQIFQRVSSLTDDTHTSFTPPPATRRISPVIALPSTPGRSLDVSEDLWNTGTVASDSESDTEDIKDLQQDEYFDDRAEFAVIQHRFPTIAAAKSQTLPLSSPQATEEPLYANYFGSHRHCSLQAQSRDEWQSDNTPKRPLPLPRPQKQRSSPVLSERRPLCLADMDSLQKPPPPPPPRAPKPRTSLTMELDKEEPSQAPKSLVSPPRLRKPVILTPPQREEIPVESNQHFPEYQNARALREAQNISLAKLSPSITEHKTPRPTPRKRRPPKPPASSPSPQAVAPLQEPGHRNGYERVPVEPYERVPSQGKGQSERYERVTGSAGQRNTVLIPPRKNGTGRASAGYERVPQSREPPSHHAPGGMRLQHSVSSESIPQFYEDFYEFRKRWLVARDTSTHAHSQPVAMATEQSPQPAPPVLSDDDDEDYQSAVQPKAPIIHAYEKVWNRKSFLRKSLSAEDLYTVSLTMLQQQRERSVFVEGEEDEEDYDYPYQWEGMEDRNIYDSPTSLESPTYETIPKPDSAPPYSPHLHPSSYIHTEMPLPPSFPSSFSRTLSFLNSNYSKLKRPAPPPSLPNTQNSSTTNNYFIFMIAPDKWRDLYMPTWTDPLHTHAQTLC